MEETENITASGKIIRKKKKLKPEHPVVREKKKSRSRGTVGPAEPFDKEKRGLLSIGEWR